MNLTTKNLLTLLCALVFSLAISAQGGKTQTLKMPCKMLNGITEREYSIYLPASYDKNTLQSYPVLYLMHGGGGANTDWEKLHNLSKVANELIASGSIKEMIIVCPEGNKQNMMYFNAEKKNDGTPEWRYEDFFFNEFIPYIEGTYRVRTDKGGRAISGFSMGGGAATVYGVHHPEKFCMVYDISGYLRRQPLSFLKGDPSASWRQQIIEDNNPIIRVEKSSAEDVKAWQKVDWKIAVGDKDFTLEANMDMMKAFREKGVECAMYVNSGSHDAKWVNGILKDVLKRADKNFEGMWIKNGDRNIYGIISKPEQKGEKQPVAIISHGFNGSHHYGRTYFETLNELGYQVYAFDFPCGSVNSRSDNNTMNMSVLDEKSDLKSIVNYFKGQKDVDADNIVLIGESQGGLVTALTASEMAEDIKAAVLVYPALCIPDNWNDRYPKVEDIPDTTRMWNVPLGRKYFLEARNIKVFKGIKNFKRPVLIVQGDKDPVVSMEDSKKAVKIYKKARLHVIPGAKHGFNQREQKESLEQISIFLKEINGK